MDFLQTLAQRGIYLSPPDDDDGGGTTKNLSPEEITNRKLGGGDEPEPEPTPEPEPEPEGGKKGGGDDEPTPEPEGDEEPEPTPEPTPDDDSPDEGDEPEPEGDFYDPEVHVEGTPAHSNKFPTREKAEFAAINKAEMLRKTLQELDEEDIGRGAVPLPKALNGDPKAIENMTALEVVHAMEDEDLRGFLNEADASRQKLEARRERKQKQRQATEVKNEFEQKQLDLYNELSGLMGESEIQSNLAQFGDKQKGKNLIESKIDQKVKAELEEDRQALEDWIEQVDSGEIELSFKEFDKEKTRRVNAIADKERQIREQYEPVLETYEQTYNLAEKVETGGEEMTPAQKAKTQRTARDEMEADLQGDLALLADDADARAEYVAAQRWALQNASDYNELLTPADWADAIRNGWPAHKDKVRASSQKRKLEGEKAGKDKKGGGGGDDDDPIPKPGDQRELEGINANAVRSENQKRLKKLEELTNAKVGT